MFYSQFILAKKGPLGTIWIAAHLERELRKNQVADTDIGVSVDSILFPDVPIALRLSSHLLLGVVRIYNRKVNYLFDDCSEALLKVKQAFRSTAVDLPPEESKAPYHSITLPKKFDLDDFELPDGDIFQGSRDQITLQDIMEGVSCSTSKFGLDERFGDGDMSGLDLEEELLLGKINTAEHADERLASVQSFSGLYLPFVGLLDITVNPSQDPNVKENQVEHRASGEDILVAAAEADGLAHATAELHAPEKLLSVPEGHMDLHSGMMEVSPGDFEGHDEGDSGSKTAAGRKRTFTESSQIGRRSSILKVKPTPPPYEVTSMKRSRAAPQSGAPKRKVLMDETMVLYGEKKAPCTLFEISMIRKQHMDDETFLEPVFTGMSIELTSLHGQVYDLGRIKVCQNEVHDASLEVVSEQGLPSQNNENGNFPETMVEPNMGYRSENSGACLETVAGFRSTSPNNRSHDMEDDEGTGKTNTIEVTGQVLNDEFLTVRDNETAEPHLPSENKIEEVDYTSIAVNEEWTKPTTDVGTDDSHKEHVLNTAVINSDATSDMVHASDDMIQDAAAELIRDADHGGMDYCVQSEIYGTASKEQLEMEFSCTRLESMLQGGSMNTCEDPDHPEAYQLHMMDGEISGFDLHDRDSCDMGQDKHVNREGSLQCSYSF
ncbi:sister chromatid cohesion 1 protein 4 [Perilla frutescens var. hirtella]|uniref:Sister chromatid cohesion 1 protein 4 n=1 Tax=Perilla frutescens var. hirtella TaxID=608512 RepID=A0AAD4IUG0_PERFH|nr:sister chromatid cohesion 1 protein 4 [Perilla frutescens var. hirtella]